MMHPFGHYGCLEMLLALVLTCVSRCTIALVGDSLLARLRNVELLGWLAMRTSLDQNLDTRDAANKPLWRLKRGGEH
jgi:hypothetical protein